MAVRTVGLIPVMAAIVGNALVTFIKALAALASGSSVMFSEAVHSFADTLNQVFLLIGVKRSSRKSDEDFGYGYGNERFFWALLSACGIFFVGAGVTLYNGISSIIRPEPIEIHALVFLVLAASFVIEAITLWIAERGLRASYPDASWSERIGRADPSTLAVYLEDSAALIGVLVASASLSISYYTENVMWDGIGSIVIGILLGATAVILISKNRSYLLGRSIPESEREEIIAALVAEPSIERVIDFKSTVLGIGVYRIKFEIEFNGPALFKEAYQQKYLKGQYEEVKNDYEAFKRFCV
ncbi:MAG: cation diffusion facilitator family transporter, partial [Candidatus Kaiserbacteria bacterium]|nr:cation diffusion facilitator family transporter [Candidatus Kaiserbacteria bacterium]